MILPIKKKHKHSGEKTVKEALEMVREWRIILMNGKVDQNGDVHEINRDEAAELIGAP